MENTVPEEESIAPKRVSPVVADPRLAGNAYYADDEIDLIEYFKIIWKYKWFIMVVTTLSVIGTYFYTKSLPKIYSSTVSVILPQEPSAGGNLSAALGGLGLGGLVGGNANAELIIEVLKSRRMAEYISKQFDLPKYYDGTILPENLKKPANKANMTPETLFQKLNALGYIDRAGKVQGAFEVIARNEGYVIPELGAKASSGIIRILKKAHPMDKPIKAMNLLQENTKIETAKSGIIRLTVEDTSPTMAAKLANFYVTSLDNINLDLQITPKRPMLQVLDSAVIPEKKVKPKMLSSIIVVFFIGMMVSVFISFIFEYFRCAINKKRRV